MKNLSKEVKNSCVCYFSVAILRVPVEDQGHSLHGKSKEMISEISFISVYPPTSSIHSLPLFWLCPFLAVTNFSVF